MLRSTIRLLETREIEVTGEGLGEIRAQLEAHRPEGFELTQSHVRMAKGGGLIAALGTYHRRDTTKEIEAATMSDLEALTPDGWTMLHVQQTN